MTPGLTYLLAASILKVDFWAMFFSVIKMVIMPLLLGFWIKRKFSRFIGQISKIFPAISVTFIIFICSLVIALNKNYLSRLTYVVVYVTVLLNLIGLTLGYNLARLFRLNQKRCRTLSIEIGMQNAGLGTVLALKHFNERTALPAAVFVFICIFTSAVMAEVWQRSTYRNTEI
jgi:BASS family bile acid:Na+ symporter